MEPLTERSARVVSFAKLHRTAARRKAGEFLAEGTNAVDAAIATGVARELLVTEPAADRYDEQMQRAIDAQLTVTVVTERAADKLSETITPPGIFVVSRLIDRELVPVLDAPPRLLAVPVDMAEPGNAGTLIRTADAMGADAVVLAGDSVDPHNGKCVRASAGSLFHVPIVRAPLNHVLEGLRNKGIQICATTGDGDVELPDAGEILHRPTAWLFGNEAHGLSGAALDAADHRIRIPIRGGAESLNLAAAASICLYASARAQG